MYGNVLTNESDDPLEIMQSDLKSVNGAMVLCDNWQSSDIIDLIHIAICFYDSITPNKGDKIGLCIELRNNTKAERVNVIKQKTKILKQRYMDEKYIYPGITPRTIKDLLIKMEWMALYQLPVFNVDTKPYLDWHHLSQWIDYVLDILHNEDSDKSSD